jgi:hypothetical protein
MRYGAVPSWRRSAESAQPASFAVEALRPFFGNFGEAQEVLSITRVG